MAQSGSPQAATLISRIDQLMHTVEQLLMLARAGQAMASGHYETVNWTENIINLSALSMKPKNIR
jgi:two-component system sensor histidine kinase BasS